MKKPRVCVRAVCSGCGHETVLEGGCFLGVSDVSWFSILDIDECVSDKAFCPYNRRCVNTFGSYYCKCHVGFELKYISGRYDCVGKKPRGFLTDVSTSVLSISWTIYCTDHLNNTEKVIFFKFLSFGNSDDMNYMKPGSSKFKVKNHSPCSSIMEINSLRWFLWVFWKKLIGFILFIFLILSPGIAKSAVTSVVSDALWPYGP